MVGTKATAPAAPHKQVARLATMRLDTRLAKWAL
jgi:hypothetical protein